MRIHVEYPLVCLTHSRCSVNNSWYSLSNLLIRYSKFPTSVLKSQSCILLITKQFPIENIFTSDIYFLKFLIGRQLVYNLLLASTIQQHESAICIHMSPPSWKSLSPSPPPILLDCHRAPGWASCPLQQPPMSCLFHTWQSVCFSASLSVCPALSFPCCVHKSVLKDCIYSCPANMFSSTIFLDSICMLIYDIYIYIFFFPFWLNFILYNRLKDHLPH